jgi:hypothetical protein
MATRMQQRRGTAAQWISTNSGNGPILNAGEIGWESDTNKFKIGDGTNTWAALDYFADIDSTVNPAFGSSITFEGATANAFETILAVTDPTADNTITLPDATGTVTLLTATQTLTNKTLTSPKINEDVAVTATATELNYVDGVTSAIQTQMDAKAPLASPALTGTATAVNLTISGNLTVDGTTTNINSTNLVVEDKNIVLGDTATPTDSTADGGGITLKGLTDKTFNWVDATDAWTSSEDLNLLTGKVYKINGTSVLSGSTLGSGVTASSLTSVGTITSGTWTGTAIAIANGGTGSTSAGDARTALGLAIGTDVQAYNSTLAAVAGGTYTGDDSITTLGTITAGTWTGTTIAIANGGTGATTAMTAATALLPDQASNSGKYLTTNGSGTLSWGTVSGFSAPTLGSTSIASGATVTTIVGLTKIRSDQFTTLDASGFEVDIETMQVMGAL